MNMLQKFAMFAILIFGLQAMTLQGAAIQYHRQEGVKQVLMSFKKTLDNPNHKPFNPDEFDYFNNYIQANNGLFAHVINHDMYAQDGTLVIKKGELLWKAVEKNNVQMVKLLIVAGADVNAQDNNGWYPLHFAAKYNSKEVAGLLIAQGAGVNARDNSGYTPLHFAAEDNSKEVAELLIAQGAGVNARDEFDWTPLHFAAKYNSKEVAELLIAAGADLDIRNNKGETAEQCAKTPEMRKIFEQARADKIQKEADAQYEGTFNAQGFNAQGFDRFGRNAAGLLEELD